MEKETSKILKGIAIFLVIISHIAGGTGIRVFTPCGGIGVTVFLICSGYGIYESFKENGVKNYWKKRFISIYPIYLIVNILFISIFSVSDYLLIFKSLLFLEPIMPYGWYFKCLLFWYFIFWISIWTFDGKYMNYFFFVSIIVSFIAFPNIMKEQSISFSAGIYASRYKWKFCGQYIGKLCFLIGTVFLALKQITFVRSAPPLLFNVVQLFIKLPFAISVITFVHSLRSHWIGILFAFLGSISYPLYLVHGIVLKGINPLSGIHLMAAVACAILVSCGLRMFDDKVKNVLYMVIR